MMGELNWRRVKLGEISDILIGGTPSRKKGEYWDKDLKTDNLWVSISDLQSKYIQNTKERITDEGIRNSNVKLLPENTVIMSFKLTVGKVAITKRRLYTNEAIAGFLPKQQNTFSSEYLYYALSNLDYKDSLDVAVKGQTLNKEKLKNLIIMLPSLSEQRKIAAILSSVDEAIEKTEVIIEQTEKVKKGLMQQLLTKGIGHTKFKKTEIGEIPEEWEVLKIQDFALKVTDGEHKTPKRTEFGELLLSARNIRNNMLDLSNVDYVSQEELEKITKRCNPEEGDILISCSGTIGRVCVVPKGTKFGLVRSVALVKIDKNTTNSKFLMYALQSPNLQKQMMLNQSQLAQANLFLRDINNLKVPFPSLEEQEKIAKIIETFDLKLTFETQRYHELNKIKKSLMQTLLTGKVRVKVDNEVMSQ